MTDVEMKDAARSSTEDDKKKEDSTAPEEPSDCFYGKDSIWSNQSTHVKAK